MPKAKFPKFAAAATLEYDGATYYFTDERCRQEFARQKHIVTQ
jgi:YHS domain-containing protein